MKEPISEAKKLEAMNDRLLQKREVLGIKPEKDPKIEAPDFSRMKVETPEQEAARIAQQDAQRLADGMAKAGVPPLHWSRVALDREGPWGAREQQMRSMLGKPFIVAFLGNRGAGKTQLAVELIRQEIIRKRSGRFTTVTDFLMDIKATYKAASTETERSVLEDYSKPHLLVLDEIDRRSGNPWDDNLVFTLVNRRYNNMKGTVMISNFDPDEFKKKVDPSLADRARENGGIIHFNWKSYRA